MKKKDLYSSIQKSIPNKEVLNMAELTQKVLHLEHRVNQLVLLAVIGVVIFAFVVLFEFIR